MSESYSGRIGFVLYRMGSIVSEVIHSIKGTPPEGFGSLNHSVNTTTIAYNLEDAKPTHREISSNPSRQGSRQ
uniref:Uncharacterized protein n=1 Tax=Oryza barthii TaxID=65489 RepID=A0A0D3F4W8_9ORYZ